MSKKYSFSQLARIYNKTNGHCYYCGVELIIPEINSIKTPNAFCVDHFLPVADGGTNRIDNLVPSCRQCNLSKGIKTIEEFRIAKLKKIGGYFSEEQKKFLSDNKIKLPTNIQYVFYFEKKK